ncbi:M48 family metalloprotease [Candidatus Babeliales bacterium]|nr:M48 family metalloprotease [Candidatus Babeliales bacterium]
MNQHSLLSLSKIALFCIQFSFFAEHFADACTSISDGSREDGQQFVISKYPGAQKWYEAMTVKYPQARLDQIQFCISDAYESGDSVIFFPEYRLRDMNTVFGDVKLKKYTAKMFAPFAEDEYLLLHEAEHVLKHDVYHGYLAIKTSGVLILTVALSAACLWKNDNLNASTGILSTSCIATIACVGLIWYSRFQEYRADNFANQNVDAATLRAGKNWFARLNTLMSFENIAIPNFLNSFSQFLQDPAHPTPQSRASKALQALMVRFGQIA